MNIIERLSKDGSRKHFIYDFGRDKGQRPSTGIYTYTKPKTQLERNHNKQAVALLEVKKSELTIEQQAVGTGYIPIHKFKSNFLDFYSDFVKDNTRTGNRHLANSLTQFKKFFGKKFLAPVDVTENLSERFRAFLLDNFNGDTPANYFSRYKRVLKAATKQGYFRYSPSEDVAARANKNKKGKEHLEAEEYLRLIKTPYFNNEVQEAFIFCCYTGLRYCDVKILKWEDIKGATLTTRIVQAKTGSPLVLTLHDVALTILKKRRDRKTAADRSLKGKVFNVSTNNFCNEALKEWVKKAGIDKHITWHCARLSFSVLLQDENVDAPTIALLLGHTTTRYVLETYKRQRPKDQSTAISKLPAVSQLK